MVWRQRQCQRQLNPSMHNDYASVQEQSGIRAGDGGFQVEVGGNTD